MSQTTILLIDDDKDLCVSIKNLLMQHGFNVIIKNNSNNIETLLAEQAIDLILLDILLPGDKDGIAICKLIRQLSSIPVIMLTGINEDVEKILSLEVGADNYLIKPFNSRVLLAYINACLRRQTTSEFHSPTTVVTKNDLVEANYEIYEFQGWKLNLTSQILISPLNKIVKLTTTEFMLLTAFLQRPQSVLTRNQLLDLVNGNSYSFDRSIDITISRLRAKIEQVDKASKLINTIRNSGYSLACSVSKLSMNSMDWQQLITEATRNQ